MPRLNLELNKVKPYLPVIVAVSALAAVLWVGMRIMLADPNQPVEAKLGLLAGMALLCLAAGLGGLRLAMHRPASPPLRMLFVISMAYLIPFLALILPEWIVLWNQPPAAARWLRLLGPQGLAAGQPWFYIWQALFLAAYFISQWRLSSITTSLLSASGQGTSPRTSFSLLAIFRQALASLHILPAWLWAISLLTGLGLWLAAAFITSLQAYPLEIALTPSTAVPSGSAPVSMFLSTGIRLVFVITALLLAPWVEELFFRGEFLQVWETRLGAAPALLISAAFFALLQFRPFLFLPAFVLGCGLTVLARRSGRLSTAVLAHMLFNVLMLLLNPFYVM